MVGAIWQAIGGMQVFQKKADITANNVANVTTDGFKKSVAEITEGADGIPRMNVKKTDSPGYRVMIGDKEKELSNVDIGEEMVDLTVAERGYEANTKVIRVADEMTGQLLNIKA